MGSDLYRRDLAAVAAAEHLRFFPLAAARGTGARLVDERGNELIDLSGGWSAAGVGYANPRVVAAVTEAVATMPGASVLSGTHRYAVELAERLCATIPVVDSDPVAYLGLAGSDANAAVLRSVRAWSSRPRIVAFEHSYHGGLGPAQHVSGLYTAAGVAADPGLVLVPYGDAGATRAALTAGDVAAVIVEPVLCDGGVVFPPADFLPALRAACDETGTLLVIDEVKAGLGRTGRLLAHQHDGVVADVVTLGKSLGGGLSLSAAVGPRAVLGADPGGSLLTTAGNPVACAAAIAVLDALRLDGLVGRAAALGELFAAELAELDESVAAELSARAPTSSPVVEAGLPAVAERVALVGDVAMPADGGRAARVAGSQPRDADRLVITVRSRGLLGGIELRRDDGTPATTETAKAVLRAFERGAVAYYVGPHSNVIELTPPLVIDADDLRAGVRAIGAAIADVAAGLVPDDALADFAGW